ncbi:diaminopimelate decarboxylase [Virgibacillus sp. MSJ-26]|uniref:diaminopimelate decarboxylase n=1 Tax=Virgibacillus sp. MSJ-26 TaxID=2841522 RepID=UPI001C100EC7|nr:diaminopimelate decarboxylase [Virgibacillus sp. MSJ-26]MBU5466309.1 diaminopimelate decarboxylase [Virgibacillus sp. MSJ-26]
MNKTKGVVRIDNPTIAYVNDRGHMEIGGMDTIELAEKYGTPLYVYDVSLIRKNCRAFVNAFKEAGVKAQVAYASKAFSSLAILQIIDQEGLSLDVVSTGELYTAIKAGVSAKKIHMHGNNKSIEELEMAIEYDIGCIIVDNYHEIELLEALLKKYKKKMNVLIRVTPGIKSETHHYIMTGSEDSKFGFNLSNGAAEAAFKKLQNHDNIRFKGLHCHIGSQIFETQAFVAATDMLFEEIRKWHKQYGFVPEVLNLGGGFGIKYTNDDSPQPLSTYAKQLTKAVRNHVENLNIPMPEIWIEPGRSIVGPAGTTLYTIGSKKEIPGIRDYVAVDGGLTDNLRPALYQAKYTGIIANKANHAKEKVASIAGKCCESGDMLIWDLPIAEPESGDIFAVFSTGAYGYSMASHYNRFPKAAVVFVEEGQDKLVVKRETFKDVVRNDLSYI